MVRTKNGRQFIEVVFFDGIYEVIWRCYPIPGKHKFRIIECYPDGETHIIMRGYKDHVDTIHDAKTAIAIMEETGNLESDDVLFIINRG